MLALARLVPGSSDREFINKEAGDAVEAGTLPAVERKPFLDKFDAMLDAAIEANVAEKFATGNATDKEEDLFADVDL